MLIIGVYDFGGVATVNQALLKEFSSMGHDVSILTFTEVDTKNPCIFSLGFRKYGLLQLLAAPFRSFLWLSRACPDLVIVSSDLVALPICLVKPFLKFRLLVNSHTNVVAHLKENGGLLKSFLYRIAGYSYRNADVIANVSRSSAMASSQFYGIEPVEYLPNPLTPVSDDDANVPPHQWLEHHKVIISCGRLDDNKNQALLIRAFALLLKEDKHIKLLVLGDGPNMDKLVWLANELNVEDNIAFLGNVENPRQYMKWATCLSLTSIYEGSPTVIIEALSVGLPVVTVDFQLSASELISSEDYGEVCKYYSEHDFKNSLSICLRKYKVYDRAKIKARASEFEPACCAVKYLEVLA